MLSPAIAAPLLVYFNLIDLAFAPLNTPESKDADKAKIGIIPSSKFASILSFLKLQVEEKEMRWLELSEMTI